jgi:hypothetical protein
MIFAVSPGSDGSGEERYVAYLPFVLAPGANLASLESPVVSTQGSYNLKLEKLHHLYALSSGSFVSEDAATAHLDQLRACLLWLSLNFGVGVSYSKTVGRLTLFEAPVPVPETGLISQVAGAVGWAVTDGYYDADEPLVRPDHRRLTRWESGRACVVQGISVNSFFTSAGQALSFTRLASVAVDAKLRLAIELYAAYRFELSDNAKLITLVSALESLLPTVDIPDCAVTALDQAKETVRGWRDRYEHESPEWGSINHLLSRVGALKTEAIGTTLRRHVSSIMSRHPELGDPDEASTRLRDTYTARSLLLHEGHPGDDNIASHLSFLQEFVPRFLAVLFREVAQP